MNYFGTPQNIVRFGDLLRQARETAGLSQRELATLAGTTEATIQYYEVECADVRTRVVVVMATALHRRVEDLIPDLQ